MPIWCRSSPFEKLHDVVEAAAVVHAEIVQLHGVRRPQPGSHLRFALETPYELLARCAGRNVVANELHSRRTDEESVLGEPDLAHPARTKRRDQAIAAHGQGFVQLLLVDFEDGALAEEDCTFQHRSQLADVSGPRIGFEPTHRVGRYAVDHLPQPPCVSTHEMIDERRYVLPPIDERGHTDAVRSEQLKERQESAGRRMTHVMRRRGDEPHVRFARFTASWTASIFLQRRVKSVLKVWRQLVNSIEKHGTA